MSKRARARELAAEYFAKGDATGWFERLYREAEEGKTSISWADLQPNPNLLEFWKRGCLVSAGKSSLIIGCGYGDDAEQVASWGFQTTAFDVAESAIRTCRARFPESAVDYRAADLLDAPPEWSRAFDFVVEIYTLQVLPPALRVPAMREMAGFLKDSGYLLLIARGREEDEPEGSMPWPLTRTDLEEFAENGLREILFEAYLDAETPPVRRFRVLYSR